MVGVGRVREMTGVWGRGRENMVGVGREREMTEG